MTQGFWERLALVFPSQSGISKLQVCQCLCFILKDSNSGLLLLQTSVSAHNVMMPYVSCVVLDKCLWEALVWMFEKRKKCKWLGLSLWHIPLLMFHYFRQATLYFKSSTINSNNRQSEHIKTVTYLSLFWLCTSSQDLKLNGLWG